LILIDFNCNEHDALNSRRMTAGSRLGSGC